MKNVLLLAILMVLICSQEIRCQNKKSSKFCERFNCDCPAPLDEIKCTLNSSIRVVDFSESEVRRLDLSDNSLEAVNWGDTALNLQQLILRNNNLTVIREKMFVKVPHLHLLDLSINRIGELKEEYFSYLNVLEKLNLSRAFATDYRLSRELCELVSLRSLDVSFLDLSEFTLDCWRTSPHLVEIHARYARNVEASASNWLPVIGANSSLRLIDLSGSDLKRIELKMWLGMNSLVSLSLSHMPELDKNSLVQLLKTNSLAKRLKFLHVANISADASNFPIDQILQDEMDTLALELLDISSNRFAGDLNAFLFNQVNLTNLVVFNARNNRFATCYKRLVLGERQTNLTRLEVLDLAYNRINDTSCMYSIRPVSSLKYLDLGHNLIASPESTTQVRSFASIFSRMPNLTYVDLSDNQFTWLVLYFNTSLKRMDTLDVSSNRLYEFQVMSLTMLYNDDFPLEPKLNATNDEEEDELLNMNYIDDEEQDSDAEETILEVGKNNPDEDDERFLVVDNLNLSKNKFVSVNFQLMFQSIKNILYLNLSSNPLEQVISMSFGAWPYQIPIGTKNSSLIYPAGVDEEILCVDSLDLSRCKLHQIPSLAHTCINTINLQANLLRGHARLAISNYTLYFLDYLDVRANNITSLHIVQTAQKYVQESYKVQNSPINYFYGRTNSTRLNHTLVDLRANRYFKCDCATVRVVTFVGNIRVLNECFDDDLIARCRKHDDNEASSSGVKHLNRRLRVFFVVTCFFLVIISAIIIYYMCSDFFNSLKPYERVRLTLHRWSYSVSGLFGSHKPGSSSVNGADKNIGVKYTELRNDATSVSQIEINNP